MNFQESDLLRILSAEPYVSQRALSERSGHSLGVVNRSLRALVEGGYLDADMAPTEKARAEIRAKTPRNAVILAAGPGMRMVPINHTTPKALLEVNGQRLIDRLIGQLHEVGIRDITVVVGFMKDSFEYLIDEYGVELVVNADYQHRNNLHSLALVADRIGSTYVLPCDLWCRANPFRHSELDSWYMVSDSPDPDSPVRVSRKGELVTVREGEAGNTMVGIACLTGAEAAAVRERLKAMDADRRHEDAFWEETLYRKDRMIVRARVAEGDGIVEINTYEQLRDLDSGSSQLRSGAMRAIARALGCGEGEVRQIRVLKKGMTNRSFLFSVRGEKYIMRIPGEGTDRLIDRAQEAAVFRAISGLGLCSDPVWIDAASGYKITRYLEGARVCRPDDEGDLRRCMEKLRAFHGLHLQVGHSFDIFGQIAFYESLWEGAPSVYRDYERTKERVFALRPFLDSLEKDRCLTHIDAVPDNFLFYPLPDGSEALELTDWEYAGMQDPHVDLAMFCIYSLYDKALVDRLIDLYFEDGCSRLTRAKIYCYIAACGLLWSNWCEYKRRFGVEFGEYSLRQYRYAKDYCRYASELMEEER